MPDFDVRYGDSDKQPDWRRYDEPDKDDDEPLAKTPASVIEMLGFDPLEESEPKRASDAFRELVKALAKDKNGPSTLHKGMQFYHGLSVCIENKQGEQRFPGVNLPADYGFIKGIDGADGDSLDCYVGPSPESSNVYVVDQYDLGGKKFDEHKVMLGYHTQESALEDYKAGHNKSDVTFAALTPFTMPMFRKWMAMHNMTKPCARELRPVGDAEFKEEDHPRAKNGQFGSGGSSMPKGMEHVTKGSHKTVASFATALLGENKYSDANIAKAAQALFGGKTSTASIAWYKAQAKKKTPEGMAQAAAKQAGIKANNAFIAKATAHPMPAEQMNAALNKAEKAGYKTMYASGTKNDEKVFFRVSDVPEGLDSMEYVGKLLKKQGVIPNIVSKWDAKKPTPPNVQTIVMSEAEAVSYKADAYAKAYAKAEAEKSAPITETEELSKNMQQAIKHYTNGSYAALNANLRKGQPLDPEQATLAAELDAAIKKSKLAADTTLYRKMSHPEAFLGPNPKVGAVLIDNGFISTSKKSTLWSGDVKLTIKAKKGAAALDVQAMSLHRGEAEVMLPRGSMFKVLGIKGLELEVEYLG